MQHNLCVDCGTAIAKHATRCKPCWGVSRRGERRKPIVACHDCGAELPHGSQSRRNASGRCWDCHVRHLHNRPTRRCEIPECGRKHSGKGLCAMHYKQTLARSRGGEGFKNKVHRWVSAQPCQLCGYNRLPSEVNRIDPRKDYTSGNVNALCRRCHAEVTQGITLAPEPLTVPWL